MIIDLVRSIRRSVCGHVGATRRASEVRASAPIRALVAAIVAFACATSIVSYASAEESGGGGGHSFEGPNVGIIFYGPTPALDSNANQVNEVGVTAYSEFDAAAYVLGYSYGEVRSWSSDIRAKLSNSETGGRFWQFAQTFTHTNNIDGVQWFVANVLYGEDLCWRSLYSDEAYRNALTDCQTIINGGDVGGGGSGGSGGTGGTGVVYTCGWTNTGVTITWSNQYQSYYTDVAGVRCYPNSVNYGSNQFGRNVTDVKLRFTNADVLAKLAEPNMRLYVFGIAGKTSPTFRVLITNDVLVESKAQDSYQGNEWTNDRYVLTRKSDCEYYYVSQYTLRNYDDEGVYSCDMSLTSMSSSSYTWNIPDGNGSNVFYYAGLASGGSGNPVVPPTNWPEEPSAPSPPELPEPGTNPTVTPTPWSPVISPTFDFDLNITTEPTSNDLIEWVKKIYFELRSFHTDAQDWFDEVGKGIDGVVKAVNDAQKQIYSELQTIDDTLHDEGQKIRDYMYQMFHWLKDQLNFQNDSFNDSNIVYWLKRIWSKLGNGDINLRPTDPTNDPDDWWDWLVKAVQNFLIGLAATSTELISEIADLAYQVMHEFPFSIPWDIAAVLAALSTAPVTPVFTVTIPAISGWWNAFDIVIDMSPFNGAAETIRLMEKLLFTGLLIWKSKELLDFMDVTRWFD